MSQNIPQAAITAAAEAIERKLLTELPPDGCMTWLDADEELARGALEAARPHLAATERETSAQLADLCDDILGRFVKTPDGYRARVGQVQIRKWEAALLNLKQATDAHRA